MKKNTKDIQDIEDIKQLVNSFYTKVFIDTEIGPIFKTSIHHSVEEHLTIMYKFWESILFYTVTYKGNPMMTHLNLNQKFNLSLKHFNRWLKLWKETIDSLFSGAKADEAKQKAENIAKIMMMKIIGNKQAIN